MQIKRADLTRPDMQALLELHLREAQKDSCSSAFSIDRLSAPDMWFFSARSETDELMGCAGLKILDATHGEVKSVRTHANHLRRGVSTALMAHLTEYAKAQGLIRLSLETHPTQAYAAARALYERLGYSYCGPFGEYESSETSVFMTREV